MGGPIWVDQGTRLSDDLSLDKTLLSLFSVIPDWWNHVHQAVTNVYFPQKQMFILQNDCAEGPVLQESRTLVPVSEL